ncbi:hypothetical protein DB35_11600 [Streptomyces abyssalis]|uniref:Uncharacterized protein n=1 Tax=Streptomyces abyssalis TaxID=933944 RepID=A0A1E7JHH1_9ACTN|nr:hypothetical protein [Streptomyces abyssalis]OEU85900.1 hypothetical protein AN215_26335 [Streptomyces abyssalis]OEU92635.1 hypothetical protein DB35_11600 [Streptomyces abyssalis]
MDPQVASGLIGFGGAAVGAVGALFGARLQIRHEAKSAKEARKADQHDAAFEVAVHAVFAVKDLFRRHWRGDAPDDWEHQVFAELDRLRLSALNFPSSGLRTRLEEAAQTLQYWKKVTHTESDNSNRVRLLIGTMDHLVEVLGTYRRTGKVPVGSEDYLSAREGVGLYIEEMEDHEERMRNGQA